MPLSGLDTVGGSPALQVWHWLGQEGLGLAGAGSWVSIVTADPGPGPGLLQLQVPGWIFSPHFLFGAGLEAA